MIGCGLWLGDLEEGLSNWGCPVGLDVLRNWGPNGWVSQSVWSIGRREQNEARIVIGKAVVNAHFGQERGCLVLFMWCHDLIKLKQKHEVSLTCLALLWAQSNLHLRWVFCEIVYAQSMLWQTSECQAGFCVSEMFFFLGQDLQQHPAGSGGLVS